MLGRVSQRACQGLTQIPPQRPYSPRDQYTQCLARSTHPSSLKRVIAHQMTGVLKSAGQCDYECINLFFKGIHELLRRFLPWGRRRKGFLKAISKQAHD